MVALAPDYRDADVLKALLHAACTQRVVATAPVPASGSAANGDAVYTTTAATAKREVDRLWPRLVTAAAAAGWPADVALLVPVGAHRLPAHLD